MKLSNKTKHYLILFVKILIVVGAFTFIYLQLVNNEKLDWSKFLLVFNKNQSVSGIIFIILLSFFNRFFEILKWQNLVGSFQPISVLVATKQVLAALTLGTFTPSGVGEYAGKALYFDKSQTKKIIFLNLICNGIQLILSVFFGLLGLLYLGYYQWFLSILLVAILVFVILFFLKKLEIKGHSLSVFVSKIQEIPKPIHQKNIVLAISRYLIFSHQYYFLFVAFGVSIDYPIMMATICSVYFLSSAIPTFQFLDFAVKGSVSVFFFGLLGVNEWIVVFVTMIMWFLNVVIPVVIGSFYVLKFSINKPQ